VKNRLKSRPTHYFFRGKKLFCYCQKTAQNKQSPNRHNFAQSGHPVCFGHFQGDQVGRIFACWAIVNFVLFFENYNSIPMFWPLFSTVNLCVNFYKKDWATFWELFHKPIWPLWSLLWQGLSKGSCCCSIENPLPCKVLLKIAETQFQH
jgi:hypothetical protein